jgi:hypothetical protein
MPVPDLPPHGAEPVTVVPSGGAPDKTPEGILSALPSDRRGTFTAEFRQAMSQGAEKLALAPVHEVLDRWWPIAVLYATHRYDAVMATAESVLDRQIAGVPITAEQLRAMADAKRQRD